ncbi:unnamed protein product [Durusdinium trenchii]|uniref:Uncharacterized protein n=1 Tax=Durusdinium trenchii TaxID=1381693 RepID=A0ABP0QGU5_9DINO
MSTKNVRRVSRRRRGKHQYRTREEDADTTNLHEPNKPKSEPKEPNSEPKAPSGVHHHQGPPAPSSGSASSAAPSAAAVARSSAPHSPTRKNRLWELMARGREDRSAGLPCLQGGSAWACLVGEGPETRASPGGEEGEVANGKDRTDCEAMSAMSECSTADTIPPWPPSNPSDVIIAERIAAVLMERGKR